LERHEAVALLKELVGLHLAPLSVISIQRNSRGRFDLIVKTDCGTPEFIQFIAERNLAVQADKENGYCTISKP